MLPGRLTATDLKRLAHWARLHLEFLQQKEGGQLPVTEYALLVLARRIECSMANEFIVGGNEP
jgi:hypothetical protein